jgi:ribosomal subunit interface protein
MKRGWNFTVGEASGECRSAIPLGSGALGAQDCCRTVMRVTVLRIRRAPYQENPLIKRAGVGIPGAVCNVNPTLRAREVCVEIVVTGRNVQVPDHFRVHVAEKIARLERYDHKVVGMEVELFHEPNRRQLKSCQRVEITGRGCGPAARAEACAQDFYAALDAAVAKLEARLRRNHDRRRVNGKRTRVMAGRGAPGTATTVLDELPQVDVHVDIPGPRGHDEYLPADSEPIPGRIVRRKVHTAAPMSVDDALSRMELVGHDFYLFSDADSGQPCVVYRRKGYDYGMIRLEG